MAEGKLQSFLLLGWVAWVLENNEAKSYLFFSAWMQPTAEMSTILLFSSIAERSEQKTPFRKHSLRQDSCLSIAGFFIRPIFGK